ncbi:MAG: ATP--guanido phosphotransferase [Capsulimonadales bacterium]|nr:ATP--guanido phosphotransferase [Capsulimonadales bacterium]
MEVSRDHRRPLAAYLKTPAWADQVNSATDGDVALCSRARLARNLADYPFPGRASDRDLRRVAQEVRRAALADTEWLGDLSAVALASLSERDRADLVDARRISPEMAEPGAASYALLDDDGTLTVFINEEDHVRLQTLAAGNTLIAALKTAEEAESRLARRLRFAHHPRWGYLTTALSNIGTGLRLSALVHLPALAFLGRLSETLEAAHQLGISVRGAHGEGSQAAGDLYQVSNAISYGLTTAHIVRRVRPVVDYLVAAEREARQEVGERRFEDAMNGARLAWTRIENADRLDAPTALTLLSALRLVAVAGMALSGRSPVPDATQFATLIADLRTGGSLSAESDRHAGPLPSVRDAIQRPARIRSALRASFHLL